MTRFHLILLLLASMSIVAKSQTIAITDSIRSNISARVDNGYVAGIVVGVVDGDGMRYFGYGRKSSADSRRPDENTVFEIGSVTKVFTGTLLAEMVRRGEVALADPVTGYLPDSLKLESHTNRPITLLDLATHHSGLPSLPDNFHPADNDNPYADYTVELLYNFLGGYTPQHQPGEHYEYSNLGTGLLGHVLARKAGMSYEELLRQRLIDPLDLGDTRITLTGDQQQRLARGHIWGGEVANWDTPTLAGAGALRSTAHDMLRWIAVNAGLNETPLSPALQLAQEIHADAGSPKMKIGLGWHVRISGGNSIYWHNGGTGGYRSFVGFDPKRRVGVVVLINSSEGGDDIGFHLLDPSVPLAPVRPVVAVPIETLDRYVGNYQLTPTFAIAITRDGDKLLVQATGQPEFPLYASSQNEFFLRVVEASVTFNEGTDGRVESLTLHQGGMDQVAMRVALSPNPSPEDGRGE